MKDVNDLMQAILEMDAAQRKASEKAKAERTARLAALDARKQSPDGCRSCRQSSRRRQRRGSRRLRQRM